ncbi:MAG TPA: hybrid sensor histidine kinase/response regulator [Brevundimonas sp.]|uniref:hybrid sensor histidine kinase/response regulator n=1 Tax=Brevundimonas naejangsanensis TaxID=588932 RepID=UPI000EE5DB13|nr:hybrid sensor histidine kinase/response regulator [Brevundimonas naejangsanensis]HAC01200.1 hybrid sensor histidine kinase/response regulator [Brevundimonas sp.]HAL08052.1 hybrid sensor histidine kinase/response regulator [Brevundimonas sp.]
MTSTEQPIHLLLVDDLEENLLALEALLKSEGVVCLKARSGDEALELLLVHDVALALLDVQMPGMDGFQLAEFMRGNVNARHIPIIFVTAGSADLQRRFRGYEAGAVDFIQKPIEADILRSKAKVFIELYRQRMESLAQRNELEAYANALREADRRKNDFIAMLGHELRNPIMALHAGLQLLQRQSDEERKAVIHARMEVQAHHLSRLIEDLLDVARIDQGKISLQQERVSLQSIVDSAIDTSRPRIEAASHELTVSLPPEPVWLNGDFTRLSQVISNLLANAAKYTPREGRILLSVEIEQDQIRIDVADNGIGVSADLKDRIFELFAQSKGPDDRSRDGLGIGLALVKQLVELHGGTIDLASDGPGLGSCFTVRLPLSA